MEGLDYSRKEQVEYCCERGLKVAEGLRGRGGEVRELVAMVRTVAVADVQDSKDIGSVMGRMRIV